jgi:hypothetical protein
MLKYNHQDIINLQKEYPEYKLHCDVIDPFIGEKREEVVISLNTYLPEELKDPRRVELVKKIKALKYTDNSLNDWQVIEGGNI